jgi:hypothetical protein
VTIVLDADRMHIASPQFDVIIRGDQNKVWILRAKDRSYMELKPGGVAHVGAQMDEAMAQMKQKLASLPDAQRKQVEAILASHGMGQDKPAAAPAPAYEKAGDASKVGDWDCQPYRILAGGSRPRRSASPGLPTSA